MLPAIFWVFDRRKMFCYAPTFQVRLIVYQYCRAVLIWRQAPIFWYQFIGVWKFALNEIVHLISMEKYIPTPPSIPERCVQIPTFSGVVFVLPQIFLSQPDDTNIEELRVWACARHLDVWRQGIPLRVVNSQHLLVWLGELGVSPDIGRCWLDKACQLGLLRLDAQLENGNLVLEYVDIVQACNIFGLSWNGDMPITVNACRLMTSQWREEIKEAILGK